MAARIGDLHTLARFALEQIMNMHEHAQLVGVGVGKLGPQAVQVALQLGEMRANGAFRVSRPRFAPIEVTPVAWVALDDPQNSRIIGFDHGVSLF